MPSWRPIPLWVMASRQAWYWSSSGMARIAATSPVAQAFARPRRVSMSWPRRSRVRSRQAMSCRSPALNWRMADFGSFTFTSCRTKVTFGLWRSTAATTASRARFLSVIPLRLIAARQSASAANAGRSLSASRSPRKRSRKALQRV